MSAFQRARNTPPAASAVVAAQVSENARLADIATMVSAAMLRFHRIKKP
jgi:hypothetical protein